MSAELDVLVVGAGPTGMALALQAHDHGARVRVVERREEPFRPSRAVIVHPRTLEVLRPLGVTDGLLAGGDVAPSVHLHLGRREIPVQLGRFALPDTAFPFLLFVRQWVVESVLSGALAARGIGIEWGSEVVDVDIGSDGAAVTVRRAAGSEVVRARYVAGCDGSASTVRGLAGIGWSGGPYRQEVVLADLELAGDLAPGVAHVVAGKKGLCFLFAFGERATWRLLATRRAGGGTSRPVPVEELQALVDTAGLPARIAEVAWSASVPLQHRIASQFRRGPLFLVGDAAHVHSPAGGQGMNTGIQDAINLGWKLAFALEGNGLLLDSYEIERRPVARDVLAMTHLLFWAEAGLSPLPSFVRGTLVPLAAPLVPRLLRVRPLVAQGVRQLSQLRVHYPHGPLSIGPRTGGRLPDSTVTVDGRPCACTRCWPCRGSTFCSTVKPPASPAPPWCTSTASRIGTGPAWSPCARTATSGSARRPWTGGSTTGWRGPAWRLPCPPFRTGRGPGCTPR